ncbi:TMEM43 family protein [Sulfurovum sp. NBC37-1]|uniref:TMEM43 family protein n=1 Tax=Sulfurovum sp. (strain NBC37-1) TaxID=387093 RepID=UPI00015879A7|nr:TMEM43 family protein [Sulfurovum sp. NBC37-1]BAF72953.1 conserved hypothetical protein [Sulfurovum sp. NBC37-1]
MDRFTETSYTGFGQNIGNSLKGFFIGFFLIVGAIILLAWNENRSVEQATALKEMEQKIITLPDTSYQKVNDGKAVLLQGEVKPLHEVVDPEYGVKTDGLVLQRKVQMYQWKEHTQSKSEDKLGGGTETVTTYSYTKEWSEHANNSVSFKHPEGHENLPMTHRGATYSTDAQLGDFYLGKEIINHIGATEGFPGLSQMPDTVADAKNYKAYLYIGENPAKPQIGDTKITYTYAPAGIYTFAGEQAGKTLTYYTTENGKDFLFARYGKVSAKRIFKEELDANALWTWILRGIGLLLMFIGFSMMMGILATLANVIPMLGTLVGGATALVAGVLTLMLGSLVIAIAWFSSRPMMSLMILATGVAIAFALGKIGKKKSTASTSEREEQASRSEKKTGSTPPPRRTRDKSEK